jgi:epoxyqueuosine reductase QueG
MELTDLARFAADFAANDERNTIFAEEALEPALAGVRIFDAPIFGVAAADDPLFEEYRRPEIVGECFLPPVTWLPGAKSVVSYFLPFSETVRASNRLWGDPAAAWLHGRIEGQMFLKKLSLALVDFLEAAGYPGVVPILEPGFYKVIDNESNTITSSWSERHVAFAAGLGTFGLSKNLITRLGTAGRFGSIVTGLALPPTQRPYTGVYEYCTMCQACVDRCPAGAIDPAKGKDKQICRIRAELMSERYSPRYGCGKCQTDVPCEHAMP